MLLVSDNSNLGNTYRKSSFNGCTKSVEKTLEFLRACHNGTTDINVLC